MLGDSDEDDSDLEAELPPVSDSRHAHTFRYRCVHKLRGWILRWRMLRGSMKALMCVFLCIAIAIATSIGIIATELVSSEDDDNRAPPPPPQGLFPVLIGGINNNNNNNPPPVPLAPSPAAGIWGSPKKGVVKNVTEQPFRTHPPGPVPPFGKIRPGFIPPVMHDWLHVVMVTMNRGVNGTESTVLRSIQSMFNLQSGTEIREQQIRITILNGNGDLDKHPQLYDVMHEFQQDFKSGLMEIINAPPYKQLEDPSKVKRTWNDSLERVLWRSKENLDFCYAMRYAANSSKYVLFLEDDVKATNVWLTKLATFWHNCDRINATIGQTWMFIVLYFPHGGSTDCSPFGWNCCTQAFIMKPQDIPAMCDFIESQFDENPIDWLLSWYRRKKRRSALQVIPNLFQHWSTISTLSEKGNKTTHESLTFEEY